MRGRKPIPTSLKLLSGAQKCRINKSEPTLPPAKAPNPPHWLGTFGKNLWKKLAPVLSAAGLLTEGDLHAFAQLCDEYDVVRRDPLCAAARDRYRKWLVEFGLTPSSRSRIKSAAPPAKDALASFLEENAG